VARDCRWQSPDVEAVLANPTLLYTTPVGDLRALADALGVKEIDWTDPADMALASARARARNQRTRKTDVERAAHSALNTIRDSTPPIDLEHLARRMGVDEIRHQPMPIDGQLLAGPDKIVVEVCSQRSRPRQRFTLAHELGHLWLTQNRARYDLPELHWREEERFCDSFAAAVLMPRTWIVRRTVDCTPSLRALERLSLEARTSLAATLIRASGVDRRWSSSLIKFRPAPGNGWRITAVTGIAHRLLYRLSCTWRTTTFLREAANAGQLTTGELVLDLDGSPIEIEAEAVGERERIVVAFAKLPLGDR
jgi:Zn-dependent peptidase ImmA (M78 family)